MRQTVKGNAASAVTDWAALRPEVTKTLLADITRRIVERFQPEKVILFGSYAYGSPDLNSDVDLLVVMEADEPMSRRIYRVAEAAEVRFLPMDVLVYTPQEIDDRIEKGDFFVREVLEKGKVLYQRGDRR